jgi:DNA-directed RNA polymerase specialized sigma24 family protein
MTQNTDPHQMSNAALAAQCARETHLYFRGQAYDPGFCLELFRRAFKERDQEAWEAVCAQYQPLVLGWVKGYSGFAATNEDADYFVNGAFGKIFISITPTKFDGFPSLAALLNYLRACTITTVIDYNRMSERLELEDLEKANRMAAAEPSPERQVAEYTSKQQFWEWVQERLHDRAEKLVIEGLFVLELKPRTLYDRHKNEFSAVADIYRIKQNVIARLSRDEEFRNRFADD